MLMTHGDLTLHITTKEGEGRGFVLPCDVVIRSKSVFFSVLFVCRPLVAIVEHQQPIAVKAPSLPPPVSFP